VSGFEPVCYKEYKDSGEGWLKEVPEHWKAKRIKELVLSFEQGWSPNAADWCADEGDFGVLKLSAISNGMFYELNNKSLEIDKLPQNTLLAKKGSVLISRSNTPALVADSCLVRKTPYTSLVVPDLVFCLTFNLKTVEPEFMSYALNSSSFRWLKTVSARGLNDSMVKVSQKIVKNWTVFIPPILEQAGIATYLNIKTKQIDCNIEQLSKKIEQYGKLKQSLINETITCGLDKSESMKDSGIEWIEEIPKRWDVKRLKDVAIMRTGNSLNDTLKEKFSDKTIENNPYVATKDIDLATCSANINNGVYIPISESKYKVTPSYSTLLCIEGGSAGKKMTFVKQPVCYVNKLLCFSNNSKVDSLFLHYFIRSFPFVSKFNTCLTGLKDGYWGVSGPQISRFRVPVPPLVEQQKIAAYLDEKTSKIDRIVEAVNSQINNLKELRKVLINDVVTGKIKVVE